MGNLFKAHIFKERVRGMREEVKIKLFNLDGTDLEIGGGDTPPPAAEPVFVQTNDMQSGQAGPAGLFIPTFYSGMATEIGVEPHEDGVNSLGLPAGIYITNLSYQFDRSVDDGVGDTYREFIISLYDGSDSDQTTVRLNRPEAGWAVSPNEGSFYKMFTTRIPTSFQVMASSPMVPVDVQLGFFVYRVGEIPEVT